jgi:hypothetical protein
MRTWAWWLVAGLVACGKTESTGEVEHRDGDPATGGVTSAENGASSGDAVSGASNANAGRGGESAGAGSSSGATASAGAPDASEAGTQGASGSPSVECRAEYAACGCGCCGAPTTTTCFYPERGDSLEAIQRADQMLGASPGCANAGCSSGLRYVCCPTPSQTPPAAAYVTTGGHISGEIYRISIRRTGADERCQWVHIARGDAPTGMDVPIALPAGWIVEVLTDYACKDESSAASTSRRAAIGGIGRVSFVKGSAACTLDYDFTLFFASPSAGVDAVHFASQVAAPDVPECE